MPFIEMQGVNRDTPQNVLERVEQLLKEKLAPILHCPEGWISAHFPSDLMERPKDTIKCFVETGKFQNLGDEEIDRMAREACAITADIVFENLSRDQIVEVFPLALRMDLHAIRKPSVP